MKRRKEAKWDMTNIGVGNSVAVKVREIDENISEEKSRSMRDSII